MKRRLDIAIALAVLFLTAASAFAQPRPSVVARMVFHHGLPYATARALGPQSVPDLLAMLQRNEERAHWSNIIRILGFIGDARATPVLIDFVERRFDGPVDPETFQALIEANQSLGLLGHDPASRAFTHLSQAASLPAWRAKQLRWTFPTLRGDEREILMLKLTINGLGHTGNDAAGERLKELEKTLRADRNFFPYVRHNLDDARKLNDRIRKEGYERIFR